MAAHRIAAHRIALNASARPLAVVPPPTSKRLAGLLLDPKVAAGSALQMPQRMQQPAASSTQDGAAPLQLAPWSLRLYQGGWRQPWHSYPEDWARLRHDAESVGAKKYLFPVPYLYSRPTNHGPAYASRSLAREWQLSNGANNKIKTGITMKWTTRLRNSRQPRN